jgi:hypothetical protein
MSVRSEAEGDRIEAARALLIWPAGLQHRKTLRVAVRIDERVNEDLIVYQDCIVPTSNANTLFEGWSARD